MYFRDVITLISVTNVPDGYGGWTETKVENPVFADRLDITQSEFYQAANTDNRPAVKFKIRLIDYNKETQMSYDGVEYDIMRTYSPDGEFIELTGKALNNGQS